MLVWAALFCLLIAPILQRASAIRIVVAARTARTLSAHGPKRTLFLPDIIGTTEQIAEILSRDPVIGLVSELRLELPYEFYSDDYRQILTDMSSALKLAGIKPP